MQGTVSKNRSPAPEKSVCKKRIFLWSRELQSNNQFPEMDGNHKQNDSRKYGIKMDSRNLKQQKNLSFSV